MFPVIEVNPVIPVATAFIISFFTSMGGVSGAFLLLPFQVSILGFTAPAVSPTNQLYNIVSIPGGVYRYIKEGRMLWPLSGVIIAGTLPGVFIGAFVRIQYLPDPKNFRVFVGFVLLYIGIRLLKDLLTKRNPFIKQISAEKRFQQRVKGNNNKEGNNPILSKTTIRKVTLLKIVYHFSDQEFVISIPVITGVSFIVGIIGGIYGIGGGAIIAPLLVSLLGLPVYTIAGAALFGTFITSIAGVLFYQFLSSYYPGLTVSPNWILGCLFGIGGLVGMYLGARFQKYFPANFIKWFLVFCILFTAFKYLIEFF